jgi:Coenzyme PQQ synthesis protein D (PqqD)
MSLSNDAALVSRPEVVAREINDGAVLVDMSSGGCFELNRIGFEVWTMLRKRTTIPEICEALTSRYPVAEDVLATDVKDLLDSLVRAGLVEVSPKK